VSHRRGAAQLVVLGQIAEEQTAVVPRRRVQLTSVEGDPVNLDGLDVDERLIPGWWPVNRIRVALSNVVGAVRRSSVTS